MDPTLLSVCVSKIEPCPPDAVCVTVAWPPGITAEDKAVMLANLALLVDQEYRRLGGCGVYVESVVRVKDAAEPNATPGPSNPEEE